MVERNGRHVGTRTPDLYRVNFEVNTLKTFPHLAFPHFATSENSSKHPGFDGELMASSSAPLVRDLAPIYLCLAQFFSRCRINYYQLATADQPYPGIVNPRIIDPGDAFIYGLIIKD